MCATFSALDQQVTIIAISHHTNIEPSIRSAAKKIDSYQAKDAVLNLF